MCSIAWFYIVAHALRCRASLTIMCVHEPVKRVLIFVMAKILGMNTDALRANLVYAMLVTVVTVAICVAVHLIMDRFAPVLIGSSRHNLASQGKGMMGEHLRLAS